MQPFLRRSMVVALASATMLAGRARAQECPEPPLRGPMTVTPSDGASAVTLDAPVFLDYSAGYFGPDGPGEDPETLIVVEECGPCASTCAVGTGTPIAGRVEVFGDRLYFIPDAPLTASTRYGGLANGYETSLSFSFCTGRGVDGSPPLLGATPRPSSTRVGPQCELPDGGYRLALSFPPAIDDGPPGSIEYLLYLSRGDDVEAPRVVSRARNYAADEITLGVLLDDVAARTPICLTLAATDGVGNAVVSASPQCFDPVTRTTFAGEACTASPARRPGGWALLPLLSLLLVWRSRRRGR